MKYYRQNKKSRKILQMRVFYIYFVNNFLKQFIDILIILLMLKISRLNAHSLVLQIRNNFFLEEIFFDLEELSLSLPKTSLFLFQLFNFLCIIYRAQ